ncbi:L-aspartate oxidase [Candidatus Peregrinibacteria bacterium]|nr:L-aspartate oxidase [Candidatus Peregrinibacteria bacterium]
MKTDFLLLGSGIAGLSLALKLSKLGEVVILTKKVITSGSTGLAQGGIAGVRNPQEDSQEKHFEDTMKAGSYHNSEKAVRLLVTHGEKALKDLEEWGVHFDFSLHREGGHTYARIFHIADETGRVVQEILADEIRKHKNIQVIENAFALDLLTSNGEVYGVQYFADGKESLCFAQKTVLATGGAGQIYEKTTNPSIITGDGMAMALRAGALLKDLEFVQFHPTALDMPRDPMFLLSEALRGASAKIRDENGEQFVDEMAPRDHVARSIFQKQKIGHHVFLDFRHENEDVLKKKFPMIFENLLSFGKNLADDLIPIAPSAHFFCGGVGTDIFGKTNLKNLSAVGEVACTGVHGANRLASNSLLEGVVFADQIFEDYSSEKNILRNRMHPSEKEFPPVSFHPETPEDRRIRKKIQSLMQQCVGVVRKTSEMDFALRELEKFTPEGTETKNILLVAKAIAKAAFSRKESLGCHFVEK